MVPAVLVATVHVMTVMVPAVLVATVYVMSVIVPAALVATVNVMPVMVPAALVATMYVMPIIIPAVLVATVYVMPVMSPAVLVATVYVMPVMAPAALVASAHNASNGTSGIGGNSECGGGGGVDPIPCVSTHRISDPRSGPAKLLPPHVKQRSYPHGVRPQIPDPECSWYVGAVKKMQ